MRESRVVPASACKCWRAPANPSFTVPVLKLLSDPGSVRSQVSRRRRRRSCVSVLMCPSVRPSVCVRLLFQALLHFEGCALLLPLAKETPVDLTASLMHPNKIVFADLPSDVRCLCCVPRQHRQRSYFRCNHLLLVRTNSSTQMLCVA